MDELNMDVIQILDEKLINKIAAGEVIERPASVVKELVENSLDAGATRITIAVEAGGKNLIQITDDGAGMSRNDLLLAVERHATSKIATYHDLEQVLSLGFRGEALSSIAAVARVEIRTCLPDVESGHLLRIEDGVIKTVEVAPPLRGTQVTIRNLFYSTPVRRKFLTSDKNELRRVIQTAKRFFLTEPEIAFQLISEGEEIYNLPSQTLEERLAALYSDDINRKLMRVEGEESGIVVSGYLGKMTTFRKSYGEQFLFVNGRFISNRVINHALFSAYGNMLERGQVPFFLLHLKLDPG
ncbi:DNA mismatch repair endonuclease MutL, partial [bacterium]|nr:DNA mismatch repair endonuclease MutL [bacterium]